jgi:hypothetical protein
MAPKLGRIEKPSLERFRRGRKLFCVPLIPDLQGGDAQKGFQKRVSQYWKQAIEQVDNLEKVGRITSIYVESIAASGDSAINALKQLSEQCYQLVKVKREQGGKLEVAENRKTLDEYVDWSMCLSVVGRSQEVVNKVIAFHEKAAKKRLGQIAERIDRTLKDDEAGLLIMADENRVRLQGHLPSDMQIFLVHPPAFNDVQSWLRDAMMSQVRREKE